MPPKGIEQACSDYRRTIDRVIEHAGRFFPAHHPWATGEQVETSCPRFLEFLDAGPRYDPERRFQGDWYRHCTGFFGKARAP